MTPLEVCYNSIYLSVVRKMIVFAPKTTQNGIYITHCWRLCCLEVAPLLAATT